MFLTCVPGVVCQERPDLEGGDGRVRAQLGQDPRIGGAGGAAADDGDVDARRDRWWSCESQFLFCVGEGDVVDVDP